MDTLSLALSGVHSAGLRLEASAHNVANLETADVRPLQVVQQERAEGGSLARLDQASSPRPVDRIHEAVEQLRARHQYLASLTVLAAESERRGQIADLLA